MCFCFIIQPFIIETPVAQSTLTDESSISVEKGSQYEFFYLINLSIYIIDSLPVKSPIHEEVFLLYNNQFEIYIFTIILIEKYCN